MKMERRGRGRGRGRGGRGRAQNKRKGGEEPGAVASPAEMQAQAQSHKHKHLKQQQPGKEEEAFLYPVMEANLHAQGDAAILPHILLQDFSPRVATVDGVEFQCGRGDLINEGWSMDADKWMEFLSPSNTTFCVVGCLGSQGVGKSSILSSLGKLSEVVEFPRQTPFHQSHFRACTWGVNMCTTATTDRLLLLDTQPVDSLSLAAALLKDRVEAPPSWGCHSVENTVEFQSLQMAMFLLQACDVLLLVLDELFDESVVRLLLRADLLCQRDPADRADIVVVFNRMDDSCVETHQKVAASFRSLQELFQCTGGWGSCKADSSLEYWCCVPPFKKSDRESAQLHHAAIQSLANLVEGACSRSRKRRPARSSLSEQQWLASSQKWHADLERSNLVMLFNTILQGHGHVQV